MATSQRTTHRTYGNQPSRKKAATYSYCFTNVPGGHVFDINTGNSSQTPHQASHQPWAESPAAKAGACSEGGVVRDCPSVSHVFSLSSSHGSAPMLSVAVSEDALERSASGWKLRRDSMDVSSRCLGVEKPGPLLMTFPPRPFMLWCLQGPVERERGKTLHGQLRDNRKGSGGRRVLEGLFSRFP